MQADWQTKISNLLSNGCELDSVPNITDDLMVQNAITLFCWGAQYAPKFLLDQLIIHALSPLSVFALAALVTNAPKEFCQDELNKCIFVDILLTKNPEELLEFVQIIRSKALGKGLGSGPQKLVRRTMQTWISPVLQEYCNRHPKSVYALVRLIHPKYTESQGKIIQQLLNSPPR